MVLHDVLGPIDLVVDHPSLLGVDVIACLIFLQFGICGFRCVKGVRLFGLKVVQNVNVLKIY